MVTGRYSARKRRSRLPATRNEVDACAEGVDCRRRECPAERAARRWWLGAAANTRKRRLRDGPGAVRPRRERCDAAERSRLPQWGGFSSEAATLGWLLVRAHTSDTDSTVVRCRIPARSGRIYLRGRNELGGAGSRRRSRHALRPASTVRAISGQ